MLRSRASKRLPTVLAPVIRMRHRRIALTGNALRIDARPRARAIIQRNPAGRVGSRRRLAMCRRRIRTSSAAELDSWRSLSYADLASAVIGKFADEIAPDELRALSRATYTARNFSHARPDSRAGDIAPLRWLAPGLGFSNFRTGRRWLSRTSQCSCWATLFQRVLEQRGEHFNVLGRHVGRHRVGRRICDARP